jgi:MarR family transcriptional regulator, lower aerobic nicotinate degradation pathway regulator
MDTGAEQLTRTGHSAQVFDGQAGEWVGFLLSQAAALVFRHTRNALLPTKLTPRALGFLVQLRAMGSANQLAVAQTVNMDRTTSSQLVEELVGRGIIFHTTDTLDRRNSVLRLTPEGDALLLAAERAAARCEAELMASLTVAERAELVRLLGSVLTADD